MKRNIAYAVLALFLVFEFLGCVGTTAPKPDGAALYNYIQENPYKNWKAWPGKDALYPGKEPHGFLLATYVTDDAFSSIKDKKSIPYGSIIVKENYNPDRELVAVTVMYKVKGYDSEHGDWFWLKYSPDGVIDDAGKVKECIDCHGQKKDNDYIFTDDIK